jgi:prepilin-type N-terminal cleavage/methylation domain-containing protein
MKFAVFWPGKLKTREMKIIYRNLGFRLTEMMVTIAVVAINI